MLCKDVHINSQTTLQVVKDNCHIPEEQISGKIVFKITLNNDTTNEEIVC